MLVHTRSCLAADGWSESLPEVDPARSLILCFGATEYLDDCDPIVEMSIAQVGCYSHGEISPYAEGACDLHNQTMTLTTLGEVA